MSETEILMVLEDLFSDYGEHANLTRGERHEVEMWLEEKYLEVQKNEESQIKQGNEQ